MNWKINFIFTFIVIILLSGFLSLYPPPQEDVRPVHGGVERPYYFRIELKQWQITVYDLNQIEDLILQGVSRVKAFSLSKYIGSLGNLEKGSKVYFQIYSLDVQHGISINELDITIAITDITQDIDSTLPKFYDFYLPDKDVSIIAKCQTYCGLGHSNMMFKIEVGAGEKNFGRPFFKVFGVLVGFISIFFINLILKEIPRKIVIVNSNEKKNMKGKQNYLIYDVSKLSPMELVSMRFDSQKITSLGMKIDRIKAKSMDDAIEKIKEKSRKMNWSIIFP